MTTSSWVRSPVTLTALAATFAAPLHAQDVGREDTVIFDLDRTIKNPSNFNWFTPAGAPLKHTFRSNKGSQCTRGRYAANLTEALHSMSKFNDRAMKHISCAR